MVEDHCGTTMAHEKIAELAPGLMETGQHSEARDMPSELPRGDEIRPLSSVFRQEHTSKSAQRQRASLHRVPEEARERDLNPSTDVRAKTQWAKGFPEREMKRSGGIEDHALTLRRNRGFRGHSGAGEDLMQG